MFAWSLSSCDIGAVCVFGGIKRNIKQKDKSDITSTNRDFGFNQQFMLIEPIFHIIKMRCLDKFIVATVPVKLNVRFAHLSLFSYVFSLSITVWFPNVLGVFLKYPHKSFQLL